MLYQFTGQNPEEVLKLYIHTKMEVEIEVNDGNTFIQIMPSSYSPTIK